ncbi:MAG: extracellular solute-binding protein [Propionibacteriaceae bacterium]|jgi:N,N'-diacetylchitobiose transport system substrate-binding protein|nr:extracellular solute-binding protein [Propionibacteriaceae bacterium]
MRPRLAALALAVVSTLSLAGCTSEAEPAGDTITMWLMGSETSTSMSDFLIAQYENLTGNHLVVQRFPRADMDTRIRDAMRGEIAPPDVVEVANTASSTYVYDGVFDDITDLYSVLGGDKLLSSFVEVGENQGKQYTLPYYYRSRFIYYRKDLWEKIGVDEPPRTLPAFSEAVLKLAEENPLKINGFSGMYLAGQDWRDALGWIHAYGGQLAEEKPSGKWESTLSSPMTVAGLTQLQDLHVNASRAPWTLKQDKPWLYLNDEDKITDSLGETVDIEISAATIMAGPEARVHFGDRVRNDLGKHVRVWNTETFGIFPLPGTNGGPAPMYVTGSSIGVFSKSRNLEEARTILTILFSREYQTMLAQNGLGPGNSDYEKYLGSDEFSKAMVAVASKSKLTPAAPNWLQVENSGLVDEFFLRIFKGEDILTLAEEYDKVLTPMLNGET